ncbi:MAG TPA: hypothetical protein VIY86_14520, partial [Pirellulaceae bacterium]
ALDGRGHDGALQQKGIGQVRADNDSGCPNRARPLHAFAGVPGWGSVVEVSTTPRLRRFSECHVTPRIELGIRFQEA